MTARQNNNIFKTALLGALVLAFAGFFLATKQMRPRPVLQNAPGMAGMQIQPVPDGLDLARERRSDGGVFDVAIGPQNADFSPNSVHNWVIDLRLPDGSPVKNATIKVDGGMPQHGHGLPTAPQVTKYLGEGRYLVEGLRFHMPGWWELRLDITAAGQRDAVTFNLML